MYDHVQNLSLSIFVLFKRFGHLVLFFFPSKHIFDNFIKKKKEATH
jgi:hypothetical protein